VVTPADDSVEVRAPARRAVGVFVLLAIGIALGREVGGIGAAWLSAGSGACAVALLVRGWACRVMLGAAVVSLGAGWFVVRIDEAPSASLAGRLAEVGPPSVITVEGIVRRVERSTPEAGAPLPFVRPADRVELSVRALEVEDARERASGVLHVSARALDMRSLRAGDVLLVTGAARAGRSASNPGERDWTSLGRQRGVVGWMDGATVVRLEGAPLSPMDRVRAGWWRWREAQQGRAEALLLAGSGEGSGGALLAAIVLGVRDGQVEATTDLFMRQGLGHLLAISGFHVAVIAGLTLLVVRLTGDHGRLEPLIVASILVAYLVILPPRTSILRAGIMVLALLIAEAAGRRYDRVNLLAWVACALLLVRPMDLWSLGFQLTFGVTAALMVLYPVVRERVFGPRLLVRPMPARSWARRWIAEPVGSMLIATVIAWSVAMPAVIVHTGILSPLAVVSTMLLTPLVAICLWLSFIAIGLGLVVPGAGEPVSMVVGRLAGASIDLVAWFDGLAWSTVRLPRVGALWGAGATLVAWHWLSRGHWRDARSWLATVAVAAWLLLLVGPGTALPRGVLLRVDALAVGSGSCFLVRSGREAMLWDCGSTRPGIGRRVIPGAVRALGAGRVRTVIVTHANYDHYSALPDAMEALGVRTLLVGPSVIERGGMAAMMLEAVRERGAEVRVLSRGDSFALGRATVEILSPDVSKPFATDNDNSLVARLSVRDARGRTRRVLLTGDIEASAIDAIIEREAIDASVIEAPHHGSATPAALRLVEATSPVVVLQSSNAARVNDPRLAPARRGRRWYATAMDGASWAELLADGSVRSGAMRAGVVEDRSNDD